jgi:hypothetical protein
MSKKHAHFPQIEQEERLRAFDLKRYGSHGGRMTRKSTERWRSKRGKVMAVLLHDTLLGVQGQEAHRALLPTL